MNLRSLPVSQKIELLVKALDGAEKTNRALATCSDGDAMVEILLGASAKLGLGLTRRDLTETPPIRDWIWFKNNDPLITVCLLYTSPSPRDATLSRMPSSA